jgi:hypothetical protein
LPRLIALFDANPYRVLSTGLSRSDADAAIDELRQRERGASIDSFASTWTAIELLVHLADPCDPAYAACRAALRSMWRHAAIYDGSQSLLRFAVDSEAQLASALFGVELADRQEATWVYNTLVRRTAESKSHDDLADIRPALLHLAEHCAAVENSFIDDVGASSSRP